MGKPRDLANVVATGNILADGAVAPAELTGVTSTAAEINILDGVTATAAELNLLDGVTATTAELNHVDGVTSNVQTQMDTKAPVAGPTFTGTATAPTVNASTALQIGGVAVTATAAELNKMDGVTVSASDINSVTAKLPLSGGTLTGNIAHAGDFTIDVGGNITLDGDDGGQVRFKDGGTEYLSIYNSSSDAIFQTQVSDKDIILKGNDGGSVITALTLDMSEAGEATFNDDINLGDSKRFRMGAGGDFEIFHDGSNNYIKGASSDQDIIFQGVDGGSAITALTLDMSEAGAATFNSTVSDADGKIRAIPQSGSDKTSSYTLTTGDVGNFIGIGSNGSVTVPNSTFATGDAISIFNNTSGDRTITLSISTAYIAGTDGDVNSVTLASRGVCTILFISGTVCVLSGNVS